MKTIFYSLLFSATTILFIVSCEDQNPVESAISGSITNTSDCKNFKSSDLRSDGWDTNYCFQYNYNASDKVLNMKHLNALFNCCPSEIYAVINEYNDTIIIQEYEKEKMCSCVCEYDLDFELTGVERNKYMVKLIVPEYYYATGEDPLIFEMNLESQDDGEYCW